MKKIYIGIIIILIILSFSYGVFVGVDKIFPYELLSYIKNISDADPNKNYEEALFISETDVSALIKIINEDDIVKKRNDIIEYIWKENSLPKSIPYLISNNITDDRYDDLMNLKQIDKITVLMENDVNSIAYLFLPEKTNNELIIYHQGHRGDFINGKTTINYFLSNGYSVLAFSMPLLGMNNQPTVTTDFGKINLNSHNSFRLIESSEFSPLKYFLEPVAVSLNYLDENFDFNSYYMIGISGGGWTTIIYSAIDERIKQSFSIAGSVPIYLRSIQGNQGDYEQMHPELYRISNYLELYIMSSYGDQRLLLQIFNKFDPCCFAGEYFSTYDEEIKTKLNEFQKGTFEIFLDDTHKEHKISKHALEIIDNFLI